MSETQQQLLDINQRYEIIAERLVDRQAELQSVLASVESFSQDLHEVIDWLKVKDKQMSQAVSQGIAASEKTTKNLLRDHEVSRTRNTSKNCILSKLPFC